MNTAITLTNNAELTHSQFTWISESVKSMCGINLHDGKMALVKARLNKRLRLLGLKDYGEYVEFVKSQPNSTETQAMLDALSTNLTAFFREPRHFDFLRQVVLPAMKQADNRKIRIWSAGCSSGEEAYSIAITLAESLPDIAEWDVGLLATDISNTALGRARQAVYSRDRVSEMTPALLKKYFCPAIENAQKAYQVRDFIREKVNFARLNLVEAWPMKGRFDVIFCRNVMIYFDKHTQERLIARLAAQLAPGGYLFIGHSESLAGVKHELNYVQPTIYQREQR